MKISNDQLSWGSRLFLNPLLLKITTIFGLLCFVILISTLFVKPGNSLLYRMFFKTGYYLNLYFPLLCLLTIVLSVIGLKLKEKFWRILNTIIMIGAGLFLLISSIQGI